MAQSRCAEELDVRRKLDDGQELHGGGVLGVTRERNDSLEMGAAGDGWRAGGNDAKEAMACKSSHWRWMAQELDV